MIGRDEFDRWLCFFLGGFSWVSWSEARFSFGLVGVYESF